MSNDQISEEELNELSMQIILHAGNARAVINEVLMNIEKGNFDETEQKLIDAKKEISLAHAKQTKTIQGEARGVKIPFSLLFAHAQDTLMVVMSEWNITKRFSTLLKDYDARLKKVENQE